MTTNNTKINQTKIKVGNVGKLVLTIPEMVENILRVYDSATEKEKLDGAVWYENAFNRCVKYGETFGIQPIKATAVCAALSPNNNWNDNLTDLMRVLDAYRTGLLEVMVNLYDPNMKNGAYKPQGEPDGFKPLGVRTYPRNIVVAWLILSENISFLSGQKVTAFFDNLYHVESERVTVDSHAYSTAVNVRYTAKQVTITPNQYANVSKAFIEAGAIVNLSGKQIQAITWLAWRRLIGLTA